MAKTSVVAQFQEDTGAGARLQFVLHAGITVFGITKVRMYPDSNPLLEVNIGEIIREHSEVQSISREVVPFSGGTTASANLPIVGNLVTRDFGAFFDSEGNKIGNVTFQIKDGALLANKGFFGAVEVDYDTTFRLLRYTGAVLNGIFTVGTILAFLNGSVTTFDIPLPELPEDDFVELYRLTSESVVTDQGVFEKPEEWTGQPGSPTFPGQPPQPDGGDPNMLVERLHELGRINSRNVTSVRTFFVPIEQPFVGQGFNRVLKLKIASASTSGGLTEDQRDSFQAASAIESAEVRQEAGG